MGVDVEAADAAAFAGFGSVAAHPDENPLARSDHRGRTRTWVRKESLLKAAGRGLDVDARLVRVSAPDTHPVLVAWDADDPPRSPVWIEDVETAEGYVAAVAVLGAARPSVTVTQEAPAAARPRASR